MHKLKWPPEVLRADAAAPWSHVGSNLCLDFHGDPARADLVVLSDGNHHMALHECLSEFWRRHAAIADIFYTTTPPSVLWELIAKGCLRIGNLRLCLTPHLAISPAPTLARAVAAGRMQSHIPFMQSRGNVLLIRKGNPLGIRGIADLGRADVRVFLSNPETETASYEVYAKTLKDLAQRERTTLPFLHGQARNVIYGERIHHREAPQALADGRADVAILYYHLALRFTRIFPDLFELVPMGGAPDEPYPENAVSAFHVGVVDDGGKWGVSLYDFLRSDIAAQIYERHGLRRVIT